MAEVYTTQEFQGEFPSDWSPGNICERQGGIRVGKGVKAKKTLPAEIEPGKRRRNLKLSVGLFREYGMQDHQSALLGQCVSTTEGFVREM